MKEGKEARKRRLRKQELMSDRKETWAGREYAKEEKGRRRRQVRKLDMREERKNRQMRMEE
jgi:hypothetical protein